MVPYPALHEKSFAMAKALASQATRGFGLTKRAINASFANSLDAQLDVEAAAMREAGKTADYEEGRAGVSGEAQAGVSRRMTIQIGVVGAGAMGAGIAQVAASLRSSGAAGRRAIGSRS